MTVKGASDKELCDLLERIAKVVADEDMSLELKKRELAKQADGLVKFAGEAENKIQRALIKKIRTKILAILRTSTNRIVISTMKERDN